MHLSCFIKLISSIYSLAYLMKSFPLHQILIFVMLKLFSTFNFSFAILPCRTKGLYSHNSLLVLLNYAFAFTLSRPLLHGRPNIGPQGCAHQFPEPVNISPYVAKGLCGWN